MIYKKNFLSKTLLAAITALGIFCWLMQIRAHFLKAINSFPKINATLANKLPVLKYEYPAEDKDYYEFTNLIKRTVPRDARTLFIGLWHSWGIKFRYHLYPLIIDRPEERFKAEKVFKEYDYVILYGEGPDELNTIQNYTEYFKEIFAERSSTKMTKAIFSSQADGQK